MPLDEVLSYLEEGRASHFDPTCLDAFFAYHREELNAKERRRLEKRERNLTDEPTSGVDASTQADHDAATDGGGLAETDPEGARATETDPADDSYFGSSDEVDEVTVRVEGS
jgi:hypothetical protein